MKCRFIQRTARGLIDGGVDVILIETIFDVLVARSAVMAVDVFEERKNICRL